MGIMIVLQLIVLSELCDVSNCVCVCVLCMSVIRIMFISFSPLYTLIINYLSAVYFKARNL